MLRASPSEETRERTRQQRAEFEAQEQSTSLFIGGVAFSFLIYIALIPIVFVLKNTTKQTKIVGIILLVLGLLDIPATKGYGIVPFALLLPAGILALRWKPKTKTTTTEEE